MSDKSPKRVLILTNDMGFGHRSAAKAITYEFSGLGWAYLKCHSLN